MLIMVGTVNEQVDDKRYVYSNPFWNTICQVNRILLVKHLSAAVTQSELSRDNFPDTSGPINACPAATSDECTPDLPEVLESVKQT